MELGESPGHQRSLLFDSHILFQSAQPAKFQNADSAMFVARSMVVSSGWPTTEQAGPLSCAVWREDGDSPWARKHVQIMQNFCNLVRFLCHMEYACMAVSRRSDGDLCVYVEYGCACRVCVWEILGRARHTQIER